MNEYEDILKELRQQEEDIQFASFTNDTALTVGMALLPLIIRNVGIVGTITISGLPQQEDHELVVTTFKEFLASSANR